MKFSVFAFSHPSAPLIKLIINTIHLDVSWSAQRETLGRLVPAKPVAWLNDEVIWLGLWNSSDAYHACILTNRLSLGSCSYWWCMLTNGVDRCTVVQVISFPSLWTAVLSKFCVHLQLVKCTHSRYAYWILGQWQGGQETKNGLLTYLRHPRWVLNVFFLKLHKLALVWYSNKLTRVAPLLHTSFYVVNGNRFWFQCKCNNVIGSFLWLNRMRDVCIYWTPWTCRVWENL